MLFSKLHQYNNVDIISHTHVDAIQDEKFPHRLGAMSLTNFVLKMGLVNVVSKAFLCDIIMSVLAVMMYIVQYIFQYLFYVMLGYVFHEKYNESQNATR